MSADIVAFSPDEALIAAEREYRELITECDRLADVDTTNEVVNRRLNEVEELIADTLPQTLAGAGVKLRLMLDQVRRGWDLADSDSDVPSLHQVIALTEAMGRQEDEIRSLFGQWIELHRQRDAVAIREVGDPVVDAAEEAAIDAFVDRADALEKQIHCLRATGPIGLAIKAYLVARSWRREDLSADDPRGSLGRFNANDYRGGALWDNAVELRSFAEDAARFVPELAPLVAGVVDGPTTNVVWLRKP
jgi:hypothetical protein